MPLNNNADKYQITLIPIREEKGIMTREDIILA